MKIQFEEQMSNSETSLIAGFVELESGNFPVLNWLERLL